MKRKRYEGYDLGLLGLLTKTQVEKLIAALDNPSVEDEDLAQLYYILKEALEE